MPWSLLIVGFLFFGGVLNQIFGRFGGAGIAGLVGGGIVWWITSRVLFAVLGFAGLFLLGMMFGGGGPGVGRGGRVYRDIGRGGGFGGASGRW
jgi:hypothetical protein